MPASGRKDETWLSMVEFGLFVFLVLDGREPNIYNQYAFFTLLRFSFY